MRQFYFHLYFADRHILRTVLTRSISFPSGILVWHRKAELRSNPKEQSTRNRPCGGCLDLCRPAEKNGKARLNFFFCRFWVTFQVRSVSKNLFAVKLNLNATKTPIFIRMATEDNSKNFPISCAESQNKKKNATKIGCLHLNSLLVILEQIWKKKLNFCQDLSKQTIFSPMPLIAKIQREKSLSPPISTVNLSIDRPPGFAEALSSQFCSSGNWIINSHLLLGLHPKK